MIKKGLDSVAVKMIIKDIHEEFDSSLKKTLYPKNKTFVYVKKKSFEVLNILRNGVLLTPTTEKGKPVFHEYEELVPLQLWLLAYVIIPKILKKDKNHEIIQSSDNDE